MDGERAPRWAGIVLAGMLGISVLALLLWGAVTIGAGDSAGFERPVRDILRAANRTLITTGWTDALRIAAWACGGGAVVGAVALVVLSSRVRDEPIPASEPAAISGGNVSGQKSMMRPNENAGNRRGATPRVPISGYDDAGATGMGA